MSVHENGDRPSFLGHADRGFRGHIHAISTEGRSHSLSPAELEQRLIEDWIGRHRPDGLAGAERAARMQLRRRCHRQQRGRER